MVDACRAQVSKAAVAFLLGERDFTDAEQRCAQQSKQARPIVPQADASFRTDVTRRRSPRCSVLKRKRRQPLSRHGP